MGNILRSNKSQKGLNNLTLDTDQMKTGLICNMCEKNVHYGIIVKTVLKKTKVGNLYISFV